MVSKIKKNFVKKKKRMKLIINSMENLPSLLKNAWNRWLYKMTVNNPHKER